MKVCINTITAHNTNNSVFTNRLLSNSLKTQNAINFKGLSISDLSQFDKMIIQKFNVPIKNMSSYSDFTKWCQKTLKNIQKFDFATDNSKINQVRWGILGKWDTFLKNEFEISEKLLLSHAIRSDLITNKKAFPPHLNPIIVYKSVVEAFLDNDINNFNNIYKKNLIHNLLLGYKSIDETKPIWAIFKSKQNAPKLFSKNVDNLRLIYSANGDYDSALKAENILAKNDVHVYFEKDMPKLALIYDNNTLENICPLEKFDTNIPNPKYCYIIQEHIEKNNLSSHVDNLLNDIKTEIDVRDSLVRKAGKDLSMCTPEEIFKIVGFSMSRDINNKIILNQYNQPYFSLRKTDYCGITPLSRYIPFSHLGIDENKLLSEVSLIEGNCDFRHSAATSSGAIRHIVGNSNFTNSNLKSLPNIEIIGGSVNMENSDITAIPKLSYINGDVFLSGSKLSIQNFANVNTNGILYKYNAFDNHVSLNIQQRLFRIFDKVLNGIIN